MIKHSSSGATFSKNKMKKSISLVQRLSLTTSSTRSWKAAKCSKFAACARSTPAPVKRLAPSHWSIHQSSPATSPTNSWRTARRQRHLRSRAINQRRETPSIRSRRQCIPTTREAPRRSPITCWHSRSRRLLWWQHKRIHLKAMHNNNQWAPTINNRNPPR